MSRPATRIITLADQAIDHLTGADNVDLAIEKLHGIKAIATDIDARTGTTDPSKKKNRILAAIDALRGR